MSVHERKAGRWTVRWRDAGRNRSRDFTGDTAKKDAERFDAKIKEIKETNRRSRVMNILGGYDEPFDPLHPQAWEHIVGYIDDTLRMQYPDHEFTISTKVSPDSEEDSIVTDMPLDGSIEWNGKTRVQAEREREQWRQEMEQLRAKRPEFFIYEAADPDDPDDEGYWRLDWENQEAEIAAALRSDS
jgi:hypothetical protein